MTVVDEGFSTDVKDDTPVQSDYFGFQSTDKFFFPDHITYIEFEIMNEGKKSQFQKMTQRDVVVERGSGNARMRMDPGAERHELIRQSVTGWNLVRGGQLIQYTPRNLGDWLTLADPKIVEGLEKEIRKANPWLLSEMKSQDIEKEIESLQEMLEIAREREKGEASSSSR